MIGTISSAPAQRRSFRPYDTENMSRSKPGCAQSRSNPSHSFSPSTPLLPPRAFPPHILRNPLACYEQHLKLAGHCVPHCRASTNLPHRPQYALRGPPDRGFVGYVRHIGSPAAC